MKRFRVEYSFGIESYNKEVTAETKLDAILKVMNDTSAKNNLEMKIVAQYRAIEL